MALRLLGLTLKPSSLAASKQIARVHTLEKIGNREVVGYGWNGSTGYYDRTDFPMPAVRFREDTPELKSLRVKEKGDWKKLTTDEKKALYRASFCQTFAEMQAPTGEWKMHVGATLIAVSLALLMLVWEKFYVFPETPETMSEDRQKAQLKRMLDLEMNPVDGLSSKWNYETNEWK